MASFELIKAGIDNLDNNVGFEHCQGRKCRMRKIDWYIME